MADHPVDAELVRQIVVVRRERVLHWMNPSQAVGNQINRFLYAHLPKNRRAPYSNTNSKCLGMHYPALEIFQAICIQTRKNQEVSG
jgi:hypothetical protein